MFTLEEKSRDWERRHPQYTPKAMPESEKRYREMERAANIAWLESRVAELESEMEAERDESEEWRLSEFDAYGVEERDELLELVEMAEESALSELGAFGSAEPWFYGEPEIDVFGPDYSKGIWSEERQFAEDEEYDAWNAAIDDIPERFFELDWSM